MKAQKLNSTNWMDKWLKSAISLHYNEVLMQSKFSVAHCSENVAWVENDCQIVILRPYNM